MIFLLIINFLFAQSDSVILKEREYSGFNKAVSLTYDSRGFIYVLDQNANEILKFDDKLTLQKRAGKEGWNAGEFDNPTYIDGSSGLDLYVSDGNNHRIQRFDMNLGFVSELNTDMEIYEMNFRFRKPLASININTNNLYIIDGDNKRIVVYSLINSQYQPSFIFADYRDIQGSLMSPVKILKDSKNNIYILDKKRKSVMIYNNFGVFLKSVKAGKIISISINRDILYILTSKRIFSYDFSRKAFTGEFIVTGELTTDVTDFLIQNDNKVYLLKKNKIELYSLN